MRLKRYWMQSDFKPVHLKNANARLDKLLLGKNLYTQENDEQPKKVRHVSLWKKFLGLFNL